MRRGVFRSTVFAVVWIGLVALSYGVDARQRAGGPPPEIRTLVDDFVKAVNSASAQEFETMAQAHYSAALLKKETPRDRAAFHEHIRKDLGTLSLDRVERRGPDAPLELNVKGSTGGTAIISLDTEPDAPYRVTRVAVDGDLTKPAWRNAERSPRFVDMVSGEPALYDTRVACQWDDERFDRDGQLELFDILGSTDKRLHAYPGRHADDGPETFEAGGAFLRRCLK